MIGYEVIFVFGVVTLLTYLFTYFWKRRQLYELAKNLPGHEGFSFLESLKFVVTTSQKDYITALLNLVKDDALLTKVWLFNQLFVITNDAKFVNKIFYTPEMYNKPSLLYKVFVRINALPSLNGNDHKRHRKIMEKAFTTKMLQQFTKTFDEKSKKILSKFDEKVGIEEFEVLDSVGVYSLESFGKINLNYETEFLCGEIYQAFCRYADSSMDFMPYLVAGFSHKFLNFFNLGGELGKNLGILQKFVDDVIKSNNEKNDGPENSLINLMLNPKFGFTKEEIDDELMITTIASFDTTSKTICTILMMLGIHQDVQQKVISEIDEVYSSEPKFDFTLDFLQKFPYLEAVIKESMRLFPEGPLIAREPSDDVDINGFLIPKGAIVLISIFSMHRDEKYWGSDANQFKPERFLEELEYPFAYAPFSGGKRICIGYRYVMIATKIFIINFLQNYKVHCSTKFDEIETEINLTLNLINGYKASIQRRL